MRFSFTSLRIAAMVLFFLLSSREISARQQPVADREPKANKSFKHSSSPDTSGKQSLILVLKELNRKNGVFFLYAEDNMSDRLVNTPRDTKGNIEKILDEVLKNTGLRHKRISGDTYVILSINDTRNNKDDYFHADLNSPTITAASGPLRGRITSKEGEALAGVSITIKGSNQGTVSTERGQFVMEATKGEVLVISYIGYKPLEYTVGDNRSPSISLQLTGQEMTEVIVTALGIKKDTKSLGYSATKVGGEKFTQAREINFGNALVGMIAGVNSSAPLTGPGGSSRVTIRGNSSLSFDNQPLYVVNGIPINNDNLGSAGKFGGADFGDGITSLNADDVEDITVLKGGSAAALYGQRGRNGVIIITTKSGKGRKSLGIELNSNVMVDRVNDFTDFQQSYGQGFRGLKPFDQPSAMQSGLYAWGAPLDGSMVTLFDGKQHPYSPVSKKNLHAFYKTGTTFTNTISLSGGSDAGAFRFSLGDLRSGAVYPNARYNRNNASLDLNYKLSDKWSGQVNIAYIKETGKNRSNLNDAPGNGNFAINFLPPNVDARYLAPGYNAQGQETQFNDNAFNTNPYFASSRFKNNTDRDRIMGVANIRYNPNSWMYIQGRLANDFFAFNATSITPTGTAYKPAGTLNLERSYNYNETNADVLIGINRKLNKDITVGITAGANLLRMKSRVLDVSADGLAFPFLYNPANASSSYATLSTPRKEVHSVYGSAELSYKNTWFLTVTDRNDWSSTLPTGVNSYNYPSVHAAWVFRQSETPSLLNYGKLRAGYAMVGGDAPIFATALYYNTTGTINGNPIGNLGNEIPNQILEPLKVTELEIGAEMKFLGNRLFVDLAWYNKQTLNDIVAATVSVASGYTSALVNVGKLENKGIEILVGGSPVHNQNFSWQTSFNYAHNKNKVIRLAAGQKSMQVPNGESRTERSFIQHITGMPFSQVMVYDVRRNDKGQPVLGAKGLQAADVLVPRGTGVHPVTGGWSNEFTYRQFGLSFLVDYKFGAVLYSGTNATAIQRGLHKETLNGRQNGVEVSGVDAQGNAVQRNIAAQDYYEELYRISSLQVYNADFVKFRSLSLTWILPARLFNYKIAGMSCSIVGRNLFYIKKNTDNIDPEANYTNGNAQGLEYASLPSVRSYGFNINVKF